jgi:hypothetical protein
MTIDGVSIGNGIIERLQIATASKYSAVTDLHTPQFTATNKTKTNSLALVCK